MHSLSSRSHDRFATTRWSVVMQQAAESTDARHALGELAQRYWYPVYAYVRRCGHAANVAEAISRRFLQHLLRDFGEAHAQSPRQHYRNYLLQRLHAFLSGDLQAPPAAEPLEHLTPPAGLELRYQRDHPTTSSPDQAFQRSFALEVLSRALRRLRNEAKQTDHLDMFAALEPFLAHEPGPGGYELIAARLGCRPLVLVVALKRLRQRLRELTGEELADTVTSAEDLSGEEETLLEILRDRSS